MDDWWQFEGRWRRGPRFELVQEVAAMGLRQFALLSPREMFIHSGRVLSQELKDALAEVER
jgi:hypothetical protein